MIKIGDRVEHKKYGVGQVLSLGLGYNLKTPEKTYPIYHVSFGHADPFQAGFKKSELIKTKKSISKKNAPSQIFSSTGNQGRMEKSVAYKLFRFLRSKKIKILNTKNHDLMMEIASKFLKSTQLSQSTIRHIISQLIRLCQYGCCTDLSCPSRSDRSDRTFLINLDYEPPK